MAVVSIETEAIHELSASLIRHAAAHAPDSSASLSQTDAGDRTLHPLVLLSAADAKPAGFAARLSAALERLTRPRISIGPRDFSSYHVFGAIGIVLAVAIAFSLTATRNLPLTVPAGLLALAGLVSWLNVAITKKLTGKDRLVFLRYFIPIMACSILFLRITQQPVVLFLEPMMLGIGAMQGVGRIGCFMVGCCHGKPFPIGFRYSDDHARYGFPRRLLGVRFFPVQLLESMWIFLSVGTGITFVLKGNPPGLGLSAYLVLVSAGRFTLEFIRGDKWRRHFGPFSEAQWTSYAIVAIVCLLAWFDVLPYRMWFVAVFALLTVLAAFTMYRRITHPQPPLDAPAHRGEIIRSASILDKGRSLPDTNGSKVHMRCSSRNVQLSKGWISSETGNTYHYTFSFTDRPMPLKDARILANILANWHPHPGKATLVQEKTNIFHLIRTYD